MPRPETSPRDASARRLPAGIWALGLGSLFMDASSELVHSLLPVFMVSVLGASMLAVGIIEGVAEATASITKVFSGVISDHVRRRKPLVVLGYGLSALTKPVFPLASSLAWVLAARFADRVGKGIRGAPRDALVADITPPAQRGAAYGLRQGLDSVGAFVGPLMAMLLMAWWADDIRLVLWTAVVPALVAVAILVVGVREPGGGPAASVGGAEIPVGSARHMPRAFWWVIVVASVLTLARFSEAFLVLRAQDVGLGVGHVPAVMIVMNVVYAAAAYPAGRAADRIGRRALLLAGLGVLVLADVALATAASPVHVFVGTGLWGLHLGLTQGLFAALVADTAPSDLRGTAFGIFNIAVGVAMFAASLLAGALWSRMGPPATFMASGAFAGLAGLALIARAPRP